MGEPRTARRQTTAPGRRPGPARTSTARPARRAWRARAAGSLLAALAAAGLGLGCAAEGSTGIDASVAGAPAGPVESVRLSPAVSELGLGSTLQLKLTLLDAAGNELPSRAAVWASQDTLVAAVSQEGMVTARRIGVVQLQAVVEGKSALALVNVVAARVAAVSMTPATATVAAGGTVQLTARTTGATGAVLPDRFVFWQSSNDAVARVTSTGLVSGVAAGSATITATSEGRSATAAVTVTPATTPTAPGGGGAAAPAVDSVKVEPRDTTMTRAGVARFRARVFAGGQAVTGRAVVWSTSTPALIDVNAGTGEVTARVPSGEPALLNAAVDGRAGSATIRIVDRAVAAVRVTAERGALQVGESMMLGAELRAAGGEPVESATAAWRSDNPAVLTVTSTGPTTARVTAVGAGSATITAASEGGASGSVGVSVTAPPVPTPTTTRVDVTPGSRSLAVGETAQLTATPVDATGAPRTGRSVAWSSSDERVATVSATGLVTAVGAGVATIGATVDGVVGRAAVEVTAPPPPPVVTARVVVTPVAGALRPGDRRQLGATAYDAAGAERPGRSAAWSSSAPSVASVTEGGLVTAVGAGSATITATIDGVAGSVAVTVEAPPPAVVARVAVSPAALTLTRGQTGQATARAFDAADRELTGRATSWTSSDDRIATVSASGLITAVAAGTATIAATVDGVRGTASLTVSPPAPAPVATVAVSPATATVAVGATATLAATVRDAGGTVLAGRAVEWASSAPAVATVSSTGVVTGVGPGTATITATSEGKSGTATVTVPAPVASVRLTPATLALAEDDDDGPVQGTLTATLLDAAGQPLAGRSCSWSGGRAGSDGGGKKIADVDALTPTSARITARSEGTTQVTATCEGRTASATVTVRD